LAGSNCLNYESGGSDGAIMKTLIYVFKAWEIEYERTII